MKSLLVEPGYYTQYPALGLLKLSTLYKQQGHEVRLVRGRVLVTGFVPDEINVTSLFTWAWKPVWDSIAFYRALFPKAKIRLGGIYASLIPEHAKEARADETVSGLMLDAEDILPDYNLVSEWHTKRKTSILFTHRGCIRSCGFCAVPKLEGKSFQVRRSTSIRHLIHPDHKRAVLWDNNILGEAHWCDVVEELKELKLEVDFNQGLDARLIDERVAQALRGLKIPVVRVAYDHPKIGKFVKRAINLLSEAGFSRRDMVSYVLFNYKDTPNDLFMRIRDLLEWGIAAYPMRYQPLSGPHAFEKDSYVSPSWTPELLSMVARARRVIGYGGAFPPYEGLRKKFSNARSFEEAFLLRPDRRRSKPLDESAWASELITMGQDHQFPAHALAVIA